MQQRAGYIILVDTFNSWSSLRWLRMCELDHRLLLSIKTSNNMQRGNNNHVHNSSSYRICLLLSAYSISCIAVPSLLCTTPTKNFGNHHFTCNLKPQAVSDVLRNTWLNTLKYLTEFGPNPLLCLLSFFAHDKSTRFSDNTLTHIFPIRLFSSRNRIDKCSSSYLRLPRKQIFKARKEIACYARCASG